MARDGVPGGYHWWNRLAGVDVDLTRDQFLTSGAVGEPWVVERPPGRPGRYAEQYDRFRRSVAEHLGVPIEPGAG